MRLYTHTILRILTVILLLSGLSGRGNMAYALSGSGTPGDPYIISSKSDWESCADLATHYNSYYKLTADISVTTMFYSGSSFSGVFDGDGHTLTFNMSSSYYDGNYAAPFRYIKGATIKNLKVTGTINASGQYAAGIAGHCSNAATKIVNCVVSLTIFCIVEIVFEDLKN